VTPQIKLHAGLGDFKSSTNTYKGSSTQFGATYTMGKFDFMAQQAKVDDSSSANTDRKLTGMGVNYNFSKNTRAYFRNETAKFATNQAAFTVSGGSEQKRMAIGLSTRF
jgi:predicted porin